LEDVQGAHANEPLFITSDESTIAVIRSLVEVCLRLKASPNSIGDAITSLSSQPNGPLAGYLFIYVPKRIMPTDSDAAISFLREMMESPSVPAHALHDMAIEMSLDYYGLSRESRTAVVAEFVTLAQRTDIDGATAGFRGLAQLEHFHDEVRTMISPDLLTRLANAYRALTARGHLPRLPSLETGLSIK
jgi:hypothetical protein